jgi:Xaa-Pro aminopeptidase
VPCNEMILAPGTMVALEPGIYLPGAGGVWLEHIALITADGCEMLATPLPG